MEEKRGAGQSPRRALSEERPLNGGRSAGFLVPGREERAHLLFLMVTPGREPRIQLRMLARVAGLFDSEYVVDRLREAETAAQVIELLRAADPGALG